MSDDHIILCDVTRWDIVAVERLNSRRGGARAKAADKLPPKTMQWVGAPSVPTRLLIAVIHEVTYCGSVRFGAESGAVAMIGSKGRRTVWDRLHGLECDISYTGYQGVCRIGKLASAGDNYSQSAHAPMFSSAASLRVS